MKQNSPNDAFSNPLAKHFSIADLMRFALPSIGVILALSLFGIIDGFFVANYVGVSGFAGVNLMIPVLIGFGAVGFMLGSGGSAIVSKTLGEGKKEFANTYFSLIIVYFTLFSVLISVLGFIFTPQIAKALKSEGELYEACVIYGRILFCITPFFILQQAFLSFFSVADKAGLGLIISLISGLCNAILDFVLIVLCELGITGAALATAVAWLVAGLFPLIYFMRKSENTLHLELLKGFKALNLHYKILFDTFVNGSSEMLSQLALSIVTILYNYQLMRLVGENGVAAFGVVMYLSIIFCAIFRGYCIASSQCISFQFGAKNHKELSSLFRKSLVIMGFCGIFLCAFSFVFAKPLSSIFVSGTLLDFTKIACQIYAFAYLAMALNLFASAFFTALNNGKISALLAFVRSFILQVLCVLILPLFFGVYGIFASVVVAEFLSLILSAYFLLKFRKIYGYILGK